MGLFNLFGGKKSDDNQEALEQEALKSKEKALEELKEAHSELSWPTIQRLNPVNVKDSENEGMEETVDEARKEEIGPHIYDEDIDIEYIQSLNVQEMLFLLTAMEVYNKKAAIPSFEKNHRKVYNELLDRIRNAKTVFVLYDAATGYPFVDHGFANIYFEKELAEKAVALFAKQYRKLAVRECTVENDVIEGNKKGFFDYLYYIGIENLIVDNGAYRARFKRNEIVAAPGDWGAKLDQTPTNPALNFAMLDFLAEVRWPVNYEKRPDIVKAKEMRMVSLIRDSKFIVPMQHEGEAEKLENGGVKFGPDTKFKFLVQKTKDEKQFIPVFTDAIEFSKRLHGSGWNAAVFSFKDIINFVKDKDGIRINPDGQGIIIPKDRMIALELAGQQVDAIKGKKPGSAVPTGVSAEDAAIQKTLSQALARMNEKKDENEFQDSEQ
ncbi:SseB family protein [Butyrivibrio proteoclasticus]|uniref:SseB family protein n=1 Tax=Butyrivibrio proteoclasticus TaxID=43305 RepID=UPI00047C3607|nr:SseB family protein [Butyrivibrio proteoclasticus]